MNMKKILTTKITRCLQVIFLTALFAGCEKATIQFGQTYIDDSYTNIVLVDSMTVGVSNVYKDSVITSQTGNILLGTTHDPYLGKVTSNAYFSLVPSSNTAPDFLPNAGYDSAVLLMKSNTDYYGDTTAAPTYTLRQLSSEILLPDQQFYFYNNSSFPVSTGQALGSRTLTIRPSNGDSVNIKLDDTQGLGAKLFGMLRRKSDTIKTNTAFTNFFKGLQLSTSDANVIFGFKDSVVLRVYYHETDQLYEKKAFDFTLNNSNFQFNNISFVRPASGGLANLGPTNKEISSSLTNNIGYSQAATGLYLKISFPTLRGLLQRPDYIKIISAQLVIKPYPGSYTGQYVLPPQLVAATTDALNEPGGTLTTTSGGTSAIETGNLYIDYQTGINTAYTYDVTSYLISQIATINTNFSTGLLIIPPSTNRFGTMKRLVMGDSKNANLNARVQLKVYYISVIH